MMDLGAGSLAFANQTAADDAMSQNVHGQALDIIGNDEVATSERASSLDST